MIVFGFLNGIILQPILLSVFGPIYDQQDFDEEEMWKMRRKMEVTAMVMKRKAQKEAAI